ncbi:unnamed protein product [Dicrocoelium dendriticum]|nr:unnamed protein product [Dicrocoelium dendriticum]
MTGPFVPIRQHDTGGSIIYALKDDDTAKDSTHSLWFSMVMLLLLTVVILADISLISAWSKTANVSTEILFLASRYTNISTNPGWSLLEPPTFKRYTHYDLLYTTLSKIHSTCPEITRVYDIGRSVLDRKLWVLTLGDHPDVHEPGEPEVKLIANIHGNEPIGRELLIRLGWMFCLNYGQNPLITSLLDNTQIHLLPSLNPDGFKVSTEGDIDSSLGRANEHEVDLNRNFPDQYYQTNDNSRQEPETSAIIAWTHSRPFVLSASLHAGALVGVYPFDGSINRTAYYHASPDDATFRHLATTYSRAHKRMHSGHVACHNESFVGGIVNGNRWYPVFGGMQDWNYVHSGCMEITLELGCVKYPKADQIVRYWDENKYALLVLISEVHRALRGFVLDAHTHKSIGNASIHVLDNAHVVRTTLDLGEYWRLLPLSGVYHLWASKPGYFASARITINASELPFVRHTHSEQLNFTIWPDLTSEWSPELDFNITKNRLPSYFTEPDVRAAIKASVYGDFITLGQISYSTDHLKADLVGVEIALAPKGLRKPASTALWGSSKPIHKLAGHIRVLLLAGVHGCDYVSTEMALRLLRHYAKDSPLLRGTMDVWLMESRITYLIIKPST